MNKRLFVFFQGVVVLIGLGTFVFLLWEPHLEGVNLHATWFEIYFNDPFLAYVYIASISFFVALYHAFKLFGYIRKNEVFSQRSVRALRAIKHCAIILVGLIAAAEVYIFIAVLGKDGIEDGNAMGLFMIIVAGAVAVAAERGEKYLQKHRLDNKSV
jgi:hypothetical protein